MSSNGHLKPLLQLDNVHSYYGNIHALHGISLYVNEGEVVTLIGSNGAGKSTTIRTISGIMHPRVGRIIFDGQEIQNVGAHELVGKGGTVAGRSPRFSTPFRP